MRHRNWIARLMLPAALLGLLGPWPGLPGTRAWAAERPTIRIGYVQSWSSNVASANLVAAVIRERLGYPVQLVSLDPGPMWQGVAQGDLDLSVSAWLPTTHQAYYAKLWTKVINLGPNLYGTRIGLVVPDYVGIDRIDQLNTVKNRLRGRIIGIDPGAGIMMKTQAAIKAYGLDYTLVQSSGAAMAAMLARAERHHRWIVITGWTPHWMWARWKLKYLRDPKGVYGRGGHINTIISTQLPDKAMPVVRFLKRFVWTPGQMNQVMMMVRKGMSPAAAARKWLQRHPREVADWVPASAHMQSGAPGSGRSP
ncbi:MAG: hypothetical protein B7Z66_02545 [Chromatiales bacterium 21-64-14]|nr:MAG: hypothetical protein B7Z66_02545 [Chromatiales bacterium 21-64-14]HQU14501.1 glycine betaine ABC transporter substrate-binding protein [Gammaproteobacteria bacterium]